MSVEEQPIQWAEERSMFRDLRRAAGGRSQTAKCGPSPTLEGPSSACQMPPKMPDAPKNGAVPHHFCRPRCANRSGSGPLGPPPPPLVSPSSRCFVRCFNRRRREHQPCHLFSTVGYSCDTAVLRYSEIMGSECMSECPTDSALTPQPVSSSLHSTRLRQREHMCFKPQRNDSSLTTACWRLA